MSKNKDKQAKVIEVDIKREEDVVEEPEQFMGDDNRYHMTLDYRGYEFDFVPARLRDQRVLYIIGKLQNANDVGEIMKLQGRFFDIILGENALDVMDAVADINGGILDEKAFSEFVTFLMEESDSKN